MFKYFFTLLLFFVLSSPFYALENSTEDTKKNQLLNTLTLEEQFWLQSYPVLHVGNELDYTPWNFNVDGKPMGYSVEYAELNEGMSFYLTTDGYLDQNGGEKGFPFGKKNFKNIINKCYEETMLDQQKVFLNELDAYQGNEETNDDVTVIGFKI